MHGHPADERREIEQLLYTYAWMVDQRRWELDTVFAPQATIDYTSTGAAGGPTGRRSSGWTGRSRPGP
jgi:SnoaL-like domain